MLLFRGLLRRFAKRARDRAVRGMRAELAETRAELAQTRAELGAVKVRLDQAVAAVSVVCQELEAVRDAANQTALAVAQNAISQVREELIAARGSVQS